MATLQQDHDLRACRKKGCKRYKVGVYRSSPYCSECGCRLVSFWQLHKDGDPDTPGLVDTAPDPKSVTPPSKAPTENPMWTGATIPMLPNPPAITIPLPEQDDFVATIAADGTKGTWASWRIMIRMAGLVEFSDFPGPWGTYMEYLEASGIGHMTKSDEISALIARVKAYADREGLDMNKYSSFEKGRGQTHLNNQSAVQPAKGIRVIGFKGGGKCDTFTADPDIAPCARTPKANVFIPSDMWQDFIWLTKKFSTEWLAYFKGDKDIKDDGTVSWNVSGFYFPPQTCTGAHVDIPTDYRTEEGTIGDIHSHVDMSAFFSDEDKRHWNWPVHVVLNRKGECEAVVAHHLPCGSTTRIKAGIFVTGSDAQDELAKILTAQISTSGGSRSSSKAN